MSEAEETLVAVLLGLAVLWLLVTPDGSIGAAAIPGGAFAGAAPPPPPPEPPRQFTTDHSGAIAQAKANLESQGEDLSGPCGAWLIINEAVPIIRAAGDPVGLLSKPDGNNCNGYSTDNLAYPNGEIYDALIDGGGSNGPQWGPNGFVDPGRYRG